MLDTALMQYTSGLASESDFTAVLASLASIYHERSEISHIFSQYSDSSGFAACHLVPLDLNGRPETLSDRLSTACQQDSIDAIDSSGPRPLEWAVEYRCANAVVDCLKHGACTDLVRRRASGIEMPIIHLLLADPTCDTAELLSILHVLIAARVDIMSTDQDG